MVAPPVTIPTVHLPIRQSRRKPVTTTRFDPGLPNRRPQLEFDATTDPVMTRSISWTPHNLTRWFRPVPVRQPCWSPALFNELASPPTTSPSTKYVEMINTAVTNGELSIHNPCHPNFDPNDPAPEFSPQEPPSPAYSPDPTEKIPPPLIHEHPGCSLQDSQIDEYTDSLASS